MKKINIAVVPTKEKKICDFCQNKEIKIENNELIYLCLNCYSNLQKQRAIDFLLKKHKLKAWRDLTQSQMLKLSKRQIKLYAAIYNTKLNDE